VRDLRRRDLFSFLGGAAVATWPVASLGQQSGMPVIGFLSARSPDESTQHVAAFQRGLNEIGYSDGRNVAIDYRWADGRYDRLPSLASDLVVRRVSVLAAIADPAPQVAKAATQAIPIVFAINGDPVRDGLVASLNRPGGNATGITIFGPDAVTKRLQLLHEFVPHAAITYVANPNNPKWDVEISAARSAASSLGKEMLILNAGTEHELNSVFATVDKRRTSALLFASDPFFLSRREQLAALTASHQIPAIYYLREFAEAGGLMAYGNRLTDVYRLVGVYVGRILNGERPVDLPVQQSTKFELVINLKAAKALGLAVPNTLLVSADEVIE
jgi:putative ABC transport system substrate-binding protein